MSRIFYSLMLILICTHSSLPVSAKDRCKEEQMQYVYTECLKNDERWSVPVLRDPKATCEISEKPKQAKKCGFTCEGGKYLKMNSQECESCPAGTYSLGDQIVIEDWSHLPLGFNTEEEDRTQGKVNCSEKGWLPKGDFISWSSSKCSGILVYQVELSRDGEVSFRYQASNPHIMMQFQVENDRCEMSSTGNYLDSFVRPTERGRWARHKRQLKKGRNLLYWVAFATDDDSYDSTDVSKSASVLIREVVVKGVVSNRECTQCPPGTYSSQAASSCTQCPRNQFSAGGQSTCQPCPDDSYAESGSTKCTKKAPCTTDDYHAEMDKCTNKQARTVYKWNQPTICTVGSVQLPAPTTSPCLPCNAGSAPASATDPTCVTCPSNTASDGTKPCTPCGKNTQPVTDIQLTRWSTLPRNLSTTCLTMKLRSEDCPDSFKWLPFNDHIRTGEGYTTGVFSMLRLEVAAFTTLFNTSVSFDFELKCSEHCVFLFMMKNEAGDSKMIHLWKNNVKRQTFKYDIVDTVGSTFTWAFDKSPEVFFTKNMSVRAGDYVAIYSINVTNVADNEGAIKCRDCPLGKKNDECIPCPNGQYYSSPTKKCLSCPPSLVILNPPGVSIKDCVTCAPGLKPSNGNSCVTDPHLVTPDNRTHELSSLMGSHNLSGGSLFTTKGTSYYHLFNFTLDNRNPSKYPSCVTTMDSLNDDSEEFRFAISGQIQVKSLICRVTVIPSSDKRPTLMAQPMSLGDELVSVKNSNFSKDYWNQINKQLEEVGWEKDELGYDLHYEYKSYETTQACPKGRKTTITLRCMSTPSLLAYSKSPSPHKPGLQGSYIQLPSKCPDGTCDGCQFHILWYSKEACPLCRTEDFDVVKGECEAGKQTIHYYPPKQCYFASNEKMKTSKVVSCPLVSRPVEIAALVVVIVAVILVGLLFHCHKSKKQLQYKYSKLVENSGSGQGGELPGAESCAVNEGEDDEDDDIHIKTGSRKDGAFFSRIKNIRRPGASYSNDSNMEAVNLTDKMDYGA